MIAYKLVRKLKDNSISPLFINKKLRIKIGEEMYSECIPTKGFTIRQGWHCTLKPKAPHLSTKNRVWYKVEIWDYKLFSRPKSQGGVWALANKIKFIEEINDFNK